MDVNAVPPFDLDDAPTGCCPRFDPSGWDDQVLRFEDKPFVKASTISFFHVPLNMGRVFEKTWKAIEQAHAESGEFLVLSHDDSPWHAEHLFAVASDVPGAEMVTLSGTYRTKVFDGPFSETRQWCEAMERAVAEAGDELKNLYFFYTTCPRCAKEYGHNYVVGVAEVA